MSVTAATARAPRAQYPLVARIAVAWVFLGGIPSGLGLGAVFTLLNAALALFLLPTAFSRYQQFRSRRGWEPVNRNPQKMPVAVWVFGGYVLLWGIVGPHYKAGLQNLCVYLTFVATIPIVARFTSTGTPRRVMKGMTVAAVCASALYLPVLLAGGTSYAASDGGNGDTVSLLDPRPFSMMALIGMACAVPFARNWRQMLWPIWLTAMIAFTLSRTSLAVALLLLLAAGLRKRKQGRGLRMVGWLTAAAVAAWYLFTQFQPIASRFGLNNDRSSFLGIGGTTGRSALWSWVWERAISDKLAFFFGHGAGSVENLISTQYTYPNLVHPHDDFLRLLYDYGVIGLATWLAAFSMLLVGAFRRMTRAESYSDRTIHLAAALGLVLLAGEGLTANAIVYLFVMAPIAALNGVSLGRGRAAADRSAGGYASEHGARRQLGARGLPRPLFDQSQAAMGVAQPARRE